MSSVRPLDPGSLRTDGVRGPVLVAGDSTDLTMIRSILEALPDDATGAVFVEVFAAIQRGSLVGPPGVGITWLLRDERQSAERPGAGAAKGEPLVRALGAWLDEWLLADDDGEYLLWVGCSANPRINRFCDELDHLIHEREHRIYERRLRER